MVKSSLARIVVFVLGSTLFSSAATAQVVNAVVEPVAIGEAHGPPTCVVTGDAAVHVVYSRNAPDGTRADLYYRRVEVDGIAGTAAVGPEVRLTDGLSAPVGGNAFHISPRAAIDDANRIHVAFAGYGYQEGSSDFDPFNTELSYLNFAAPSDMNYAVGELPEMTVHVARVVDNAYRSGLDEDVSGLGSYDLYQRTRPNITLRCAAGEPTEIHIAFSSAAATYTDSNGTHVGTALDYARFEVSASDGTFLTDGSGFLVDLFLRRLGVNRAMPGLVYHSAFGKAFPLPSGCTQVFGKFLRPDGAFHHIVLDPVGTVLYEKHGWAENTVADFGACLDSSGNLRVATGDVVGDHAGLGLVLATTITGDETSGYSASVEETYTSGAYDGRYYYGQGDAAVCPGSVAYALTGINTTSEGYLFQLAFPGYTYGVTDENPNIHAYDLDALDADGAALVAVFTVGAGCGGSLMNEPPGAAAGRVDLTVFREPDPKADVVARILSPEDGTVLDKGRVTLVAADGSPGDERYDWYDDGKSIGEGQSVTVNLKRGVHHIELLVSNGATAWDSITLYYGVEPPSEPTPGITVEPTSLTTTEGGTDTFTVVLDTQPTQSVTIWISSSDTIQVKVLESSVTFTPTDWDQPKTVRVEAVDDAAVEGDQTYSVTTAAATSGDGNYDELNPDDVAVTVVDNDGTEPPPPPPPPSGVTYPATLPADGITIPDNDAENPAVSTLTPQVTDGSTVATLSVTVQVTHEREGDLVVTLVAPDGTASEMLGGASGTFSTSNFTGQLVGGTWTLRVADTKKKKTGTLIAWSITVVAQTTQSATAVGDSAGATPAASTVGGTTDGTDSDPEQGEASGGTGTGGTDAPAPSSDPKTLEGEVGTQAGDSEGGTKLGGGKSNPGPGDGFGTSDFGK